MNILLYGERWRLVFMGLISLIGIQSARLMVDLDALGIIFISN